MPVIGKFQYDPTDERLMKHLDSLADEERKQRAAEISTYWRYYLGNHPDMLKVPAGKMNDNVKLNHCSVAIDRLAAFFAPAPPAIELADSGDDSTGDESEVPAGPMSQDALDGWFEDNDFEAFMSDLALSGFVTGHTFIKLYWVTPDENVFPGDINVLVDEMGRVLRFALLDPKHVTCFWLSGNTKRAVWWRVQWEVEGAQGREQRRQDIVPDMAVPEAGSGEPSYNRWLIIEYKLNGSRWEEIRDEQGNSIGRVEWPYPFPPIVEWKNQPLPNTYYGASDLRHYELNNTINFIASNSARIVKFHAHPRDLLMGVDPANPGLKETAVDGIFALPDGVKVERLPNQSDLASSMDLLDRLETRFYALARVVDLTSIKDKLGQLTNFGVRMLFSDMLANIEQKRRIYGAGLGTLAQYAIYVLWNVPVERPVARWSDPLPVNLAEAVTVAKGEKDLGFVSEQTIAEGLHLDYDAEQEKLNQEGDSSVGQLERIMRLPDTFGGGDGGNGNQAPGRLMSDQNIGDMYDAMQREAARRNQR